MITIDFNSSRFEFGLSLAHMEDAVELVLHCERRHVCFISDFQIIIDVINSTSIELP